MVGKVTTVELNNNLLESGSVVVIKDHSLLEICTVLHIAPSGQWIVLGQSFDTMEVGVRTALCKLVVANENGTYPLKFNQWDKAIKNGEVDSSKEITFELVSPKFNSGKYMKTCQGCQANYMGARAQNICKVCTAEDITAKIIITKVVKPKRPRMKQDKSLTITQAMLTTAYEMGKDGKNATQFNKWLQKQI
jgi:hypothetical protein